MNEKVKQPTIFLPHGGGPCFFMDWDPPDTWNKTAAFLASIPSSLPANPAAMLVVSGHWQEPEFTVTSGKHPSLIYDYSGFPPHTYQLKYPAPGSPELAARVKGLLKQGGIACHGDANRGFDHGVFIPLKVAFPDAQIPIVQLSLRSDLDAEGHLAAGRALQPLRDENVLIVGSGMSYHNLRRLFSGRVIPESDSFDAWLTDAVTQPGEARAKRLRHWEEAPFARDAHPEPEHLIPLMIAAGGGEADIGRRTFQDRVMGAIISAYQFG
jgi:aromatic ring-opening dioxygenase catalytic subunit (LigB family)